MQLSTGAYAVSNSIGGGGEIDLIGAGNTITLSGNNSFTGLVVTNANTLKLGSATALGNSSGVTVSASGTLDLNGQTVGSSASVAGIAGILTNSSTATSTFGGNIGGATGFIVTGGGVINLSGGVALTNNSVITTIGTNTLILSGTADNGATGLSASGPTSGTGSSGSVVILSKSSDASHHAVGSNGMTINNGGTVQLAGTGNDQIADNTLVSIDNGTFDLNGHSETVGNLLSSGKAGIITNTASGSASVLTIGGQNTGGGTFSGTIHDGAGTVSIIKTGTSTITFAGANTYSGGTAVTGGTLNANAANSLGSGTLAVNNANTGTATSVIINFNASQAVSGLSSAVSGTSGNTAQVKLLASGVTLADTQSGTTTYAGSISGTGTLSINGAGSGASAATVNYTGTDIAGQTNVGANATLQLSNSTSSPALSGPVAVATGGTLGISANTASNEIATTTPPTTTPTTAAVTLNGGTLNASGSDGTVNTPAQLATATVKTSMGALALGANGTQMNPSLLAFGSAGTASSPLILAFADSKNTLGSGYLNITGYTGTTNALYIGTTADLSTAQLGQISFNGLKAGQLTNGEIYALAAAPEPGGMLSLLVGMGSISGLVWRRRRKDARAAAVHS